MARVSAPGAAFLQHVSDPPPAVSSFLPLLPAKCAAGRMHPAADHWLCASHADLRGTADAKAARPMDAPHKVRGSRTCERAAGKRARELGPHGQDYSLEKSGFGGGL